MRLWTLHPKHLDTKGLVALWREGLLAQACLAGKTKGYKNHSQLIRFKQCKDPVKAIGYYLHVVHQEATSHGYKFDSSKIIDVGSEIMCVTAGQVLFELEHLNKKLTVRSPKDVVNSLTDLYIHPMFRVIDGDIEPWEKL